jgi:alpha-1,2-mannosyltransferase
MVTKPPRLMAAVDRLSTRQLFMLVAIPLFAIFLATAAWSRQRVDVDGFTNVVTAWSLGTTGSPYLPEHVPLTAGEYPGYVSWIVAYEDTAIGKYPPGAALHAAPLYAVWPQAAPVSELDVGHLDLAAPPPVPVPPYGPSAIVSALVVALAMGFLAVSFRRYATVTTAAMGAYVAGLGTAAWSVAANTLWQHGPGMLWIALAGVLAAGHRFASGAAYGVAVVVRPLNALIAAGTGLYLSWRERNWRPAAKIGAGALIGLVALVAYNTAVYGQVSVLGGYSSAFVDNAAELDLAGYVGNLGLALLSRSRGLLIWSPFLIVLLPGLRAAWRAAPSWVRGAALGGVAYLLVLLKANRFSGGGGFPAYRYPLEAVTAAAPLLFLAYTEWVAKRPFARRLLLWLAALSIAIHTLFATWY